jgi:hypothetical protein
MYIHYKTLSRKANLNVRKTIRPVVTYGSETWTLTKKDESRILERKVLTIIFGPVSDRGIWRIRSNKELEDLYLHEKTDLATAVKTLRLRWLGHVCRMEEQRDPKKVLEGNPGGRRKRGKPRTRWIDNVEDDLRKMGIKRWRLRTADRREWRGICEAARVLQEL